MITNDLLNELADDEGSVLESAVNYPNIFFLMHKWFTTSESLTNDLWQLFESGKPSYHGDYLSLLATIQQSARTDANGSQEIGPSSRPPSVILSRKQVTIWFFISRMTKIAKPKLHFLMNHCFVG